MTSPHNGQNTSNLDQRLDRFFSENTVSDIFVEQVMSQVVAEPRTVPQSWGFIARLWGGITSAAAAALVAGMLTVGAQADSTQTIQEADGLDFIETALYGPTWSVDDTPQIQEGSDTQ